MAGIGTIIAGVTIGGAAFGTVLALVDPLGARKPKRGGDEDIAAWSDGALDSVATANATLTMLGYSGPNAIVDFQRDVNEVLVWHRALAEGQERVPPEEAGFTQIPPALQHLSAAPALAMNNEFDAPTVGQLADALAGAVFASGKTCVTDEGNVVEADAHACQEAWQQAFRYAYEANLAAGAPGGPPSGTGFDTGTTPEYDEWQEPTQNVMQENGTYGPYLWRTYKDNVGRANYKYYYKTWRQGEGLAPAMGPFETAPQAKDAVFAFIADQLGQAPGDGSGRAGTQWQPPGDGGGAGFGPGLGG